MLQCWLGYLSNSFSECFLEVFFNSKPNSEEPRLPKTKRFVMSSSPFDCSWSRCLDFLASRNFLPNETPLVPWLENPGKCKPYFMRRSSRCLDTWWLQPVTRCLAWFYVTFDITLRLFLSYVQRLNLIMWNCSKRENPFAYKLWRDAPVNFQASSPYGWLLFAIWWTRRTKVATTSNVQKIQKLYQTESSTHPTCYAWKNLSLKMSAWPEMHLRQLISPAHALFHVVTARATALTVHKNIGRPTCERIHLLVHPQFHARFRMAFPVCLSVFLIKDFASVSVVVMFANGSPLTSDSFVADSRCITQLLWIMDSVSSRFQAIPARSSGIFARLQTSQSRNFVPANWLACISSLLGPFRDRRKIGWLFFGPSPSLITGFSFGSYTFSTTTLRESGRVHQRILLSVSRMQSVARCLAWMFVAWDIGLKNFSRLVSWWSGTLEFEIGRPTPSKGHRGCEVLFKQQQLAHVSQTWTLSLFHLLQERRVQQNRLDAIRCDHKWLFHERKKLDCETELGESWATQKNYEALREGMHLRVSECANAENVQLWTVWCLHL